jgi:hypothetical protein
MSPLYFLFLKALSLWFIIGFCEHTKAHNGLLAIEITIKRKDGFIWISYMREWRRHVKLFLSQ